MEQARLIILSGVSGSGKSTALRVLEDAGFFCVDNLPAPLIMPFVEFLEKLPRMAKDAPAVGEISEMVPARVHEFSQFALLVDCREQNSFPLISKAVKRLNSSLTKVTLLFLDCDDDAAIRRFQETRRSHPLLGRDAQANSIAEALHRERALLSDFRQAADWLINTTGYTVHELRRVLLSYLSPQGEKQSAPQLTVMSFGFKFGLPIDADLVLDVRFLSNPYFVPELKDLTGTAPEVKEFVLADPDAKELISRFNDFLSFLLPRYESEGKKYLHVAIGCTGGKHRSVVCAEELSRILNNNNYPTQLKHRDLRR